MLMKKLKLKLKRERECRYILRLGLFEMKQSHSRSVFLLQDK
jgi:hypothetical protein